ncbi:hypothetical protein D918_02266 [Trichuris suis]|nr:hypothetical protein D918_02266 [Trichuris suis]
MSKVLLGKSRVQLQVTPIPSDETVPKPVGSAASDAYDGERAVRCCIETWNVRSTNQGKLEVVRREMKRVNIAILGVSEIHWIGAGEFNSGNHYIYYCGHKSVRRNGLAPMVGRRIRRHAPPKNDRMLSIRIQGKPFNITVIQVYTLTAARDESEFNQFYADLQFLLEENTKKRCHAHPRGLER